MRQANARIGQRQITLRLPARPRVRGIAACKLQAITQHWRILSDPWGRGVFSNYSRLRVCATQRDRIFGTAI